ncbi:MAG: stage III sporulation protein AB [Clostridia bacterium]|nr:stage III sporulation protein AB [Clostridia bacterium]
MIILKILLSGLIVICATYIGILISKKYVYRLQELDEIKNCFNVMSTKIKFTYEPIIEIFEEIGEISSPTIKNMYRNVITSIEEYGAKEGWEKGILKTDMSINKEDKEILMGFGKMLGKTDKDGQLSEIYLTESLLDRQIKNAELEKSKNERLYRKLGLICGVGLVVILI